MKAQLRVARGIAALVALSVGITACGSGGDASSDQALEGTIEISAPLSLSDVAAFAGESTRNGMEFAIEEINSSGYLGNAKLKADFKDVALANDQAITVVRSAINSKAVAIVGLTIGNQALAVAPIAQQSKIPLVVANSGGISKLTEVGDHIYQTDVGQYLYAGKMADELAARKVKTTALLYNDDVPAVLDLVEAYEKTEFPRVGIDVTRKSAVASSVTDYSAAVTSLLASKPDSIGVLLRGTGSAVTVVKQLKQAGYKGEIYSQAGLAGGAGAAAAPDTNGVLFTANAVAGSNIEPMEKFFASYREANGKDEFAFAAQGYDAVWAVARALKTSGCVSRQCVQDGLQKLMETGYSGALGDVTFKDRNAQGPGTIIEIVDGKETFVR